MQRFSFGGSRYDRAVISDITACPSDEDARDCPWITHRFQATPQPSTGATPICDHSYTPCFLSEHTYMQKEWTMERAWSNCMILNLTLILSLTLAKLNDLKFLNLSNSEKEWLKGATLTAGGQIQWDNVCKNILQFRIGERLKKCY